MNEKIKKHLVMHFLRNFPFVIVILLNLHKMAVDNKDTECKKVVKDRFLNDLTRII